jgi:hypothetical protein
MARGDNIVVDGQVTFERGVDTHRSPSRVPRNQACLLVNCITRSDYIGSRPGWRQIPLNWVKFVTEEDGSFRYTEDAAARLAFESGYFQGFSGYNSDDSVESSLVFSISGQIFVIDPLGNRTAQKLIMPEGNNAPNQPLAWFCQAEQFLVIQDGQSKPLIYNGSSLRRSDTIGAGGADADGKPLLEVPVGTAMAYSGGRIWVSIDEGRSFVAGDGVYGPTGTEAYQRRDAVLRFTENEYLSGGFPFPVPANMGRIRAMVPLANLDTSLGQGPLQVFTTLGCFSVQAPFDRSLWAVMTDPIRTVSLLDNGSVSHRGCVLVNGDVWYRSLDGVRSFRIARRDFQGWGNRPMSVEIFTHLRHDNLYLLDRESGTLFDNRLIKTCSPRWDALHGVYHPGLVILDFVPLSSVIGEEPPCWDGLWVGKDILQVLTVHSNTGIPHCYAAVLGQPDEFNTRKIELWELTHDRNADMPLNAPKQRLQRIMEGVRVDFQTPGRQKLLEACDIWLDKVKGLVDVSLYYRPDEHACWFFWKRWTVCATNERCAGLNGQPSCGRDPSNCTAPNYAEQYRARIGALRPPDYFVPGANEISRLGYFFQIRMEIEGDCEVMGMRLLATKVTEATFAVPPSATCEEVTCCEEPGFHPPLPPPPDDGGETPPDEPPPPVIIPFDPPLEVTYPSEGCKDEIQVDLPEIGGSTNVTVEVGDTVDGPWTFWGETREPVTSLTLSNYFGGKFVRIKAVAPAGYAWGVINPDPPTVPPPTFSVELGKNHFDSGSGSFITTWYPPVLSPKNLIYQADSVANPANKIAAVYTGNLTDPSSHKPAYQLALFSDAFVEVGPRYWMDFDAGYNRIRITLAAIPGATTKLTVDGSDPTTSHGFSSGTEIGYDTNPERKPYAICRAFKDGCKSPPVYLAFDQSLRTGTNISPLKGSGSTGGSCKCYAYVWVELDPVHDPGNCGPSPGIFNGGTCHNSFNTPCDYDTSVTVDSSGMPVTYPAMLVVGWSNVAVLALAATPAGDGTMVMNNSAKTFGFSTAPGDLYEGPEIDTCPSLPWGGGYWKFSCSMNLLRGVHYSWQSAYNSRPTDCFYLAEISWLDNGAAVTRPLPGDDRYTITGLSGASGSSTNNLGDVIFSQLPSEPKSPQNLDGSSHTYTLDNCIVTETVCNS